MQVPNPIILQKLRITPVSDSSSEQEGQPFIAMFNPNEYTLTYRNARIRHRTRTPNARSSEYGGQDTQTFRVRLLLDGTGAAETASSIGQDGSVEERVRRFLTICYRVEGNRHQPHRLHIQWGIIDFFGWLQSVEVHYTLFDHSGNPLRAELATEFIGTDDQDFTHLNSPDLTHVRIAKAGDTLPLLAKEIYGSSRYYLFLAKANDLDDFRNLVPGTRLHCPPLTTA